jgi:hypothetical protein
MDKPPSIPATGVASKDAAIARAYRLFWDREGPGYLPLEQEAIAQLSARGVAGHGLDATHLTALYAYTLTRGAYCHQAQLNMGLRAGCMETIRAFAPHIALIMAATRRLSTISGYSGWVHRRCDLPYDACDLRPGVRLADKGFLSTSAGESGCVGWVSLHLEVDTGANIQRYSSAPDEEEILLLPGFTAEITGVRLTGEDLCITARECDMQHTEVLQPMAA